MGDDRDDPQLAAGLSVRISTIVNPTGPASVFTPGAWDAFTAGVADGEFDCRWRRTRRCGHDLIGNGLDVTVA
ncbi:DUF397 domain-containing protein [Nocardia vinacea]|uniref:DUF397 domain-containing protein n=1 Tax=Nocardia vinacea TaxID=96468 RepID=UPI00146E998A